jgi:Terminase small subunit
MPALRSARHEKFAQAVASGTCSGAEAYRQASGGRPKNADVMASRWLTNASIKQRVAELRESAAAASDITRQEVVRVLSDIVRLKPNEPITYDVKLRASAQLSKMLGWNEPEKHDVNIGSQAELQAVIAKMRGAGVPGNGQCVG